jgi:hypothetical protein
MSVDVSIEGKMVVVGGDTSTNNSGISPETLAFYYLSNPSQSNSKVFKTGYSRHVSFLFSLSALEI